MPKVRPIDANALTDKLDEMISKAILADTQIRYALIRELIAEQPTIEPEVRHGRWEYDDVNDLDYCSECGTGMNGEFPFCPWCGADMRKEGAENG